MFWMIVLNALTSNYDYYCEIPQYCHTNYDYKADTVVRDCTKSRETMHASQICYLTRCSHRSSGGTYEYAPYMRT